MRLRAPHAPKLERFDADDGAVSNGSKVLIDDVRSMSELMLDVGIAFGGTSLHRRRRPAPTRDARVRQSRAGSGILTPAHSNVLGQRSFG